MSSEGLEPGEPMQIDGCPQHAGQVLVCDRNLLMAAVVVDFLSECDLQPMDPVGRLESDKHMARESALDGAILDINLNGRPCLPVCAILSDRRIPFIFLTGYPLAAVPIEYRNAPLAAKPFEPNDLRGILAHCPGSALLRQISELRKRRISGSS